MAGERRVSVRRSGERHGILDWLSWHTGRLESPVTIVAIDSAIAMSLLSRLQPKLGRYAIPNLTVIVIVGQVFLYRGRVNLDMGNGGDVLDRIAVLSGEGAGGRSLAGRNVHVRAAGEQSNFCVLLLVFVLSVRHDAGDHVGDVSLQRVFASRLSGDAWRRHLRVLRAAKDSARRRRAGFCTARCFWHSHGCIPILC